MTRTCEGCGAELTRSPGTKNSEWLRKRFCTAGCRVASGYASIEVEADDEAIALATKNLGAACIALFQRTAERRHITLEQAARAHLCGAC